ncbi:TetR/AcrR family transcriptional regulator [Paraburkholderia dipogonis]|uniref:TetR/AcrR family transcriptional regulator n=1 Tax=Paraburkholderia dipogonis TaxID=1211383 RepID=A0A4Y8NB52_9BURK|nr:TetR/AcrR family transcriptional regulator [Paraburkholderia dipogonis]TFE46994.1 TetR/AcrR family transcriptional regulator [Paraburkholderia dipogonis]
MRKRNVNPNADTRETLLRLAARSFATQGYAATTMRSIADQAGIEAASIYYHFSSKEELVDVVMEHGADSIVQHINEHLGALPANANAEDRFKAVLVGQMSALIKFGDYALAHGRLLSQLPDNVRTRQVKRRERHQQLWTTVFNDLRTEGYLREDVDIALCRVFILGCINSVQTWFDPKKGALDKVADQLCAMFFEGVKPAHAAVSWRGGRKAEVVA